MSSSSNGISIPLSATCYSDTEIPVTPDKTPNFISNLMRGSN